MHSHHFFCFLPKQSLLGILNGFQSVCPFLIQMLIILLSISNFLIFELRVESTQIIDFAP